MELDEALTQRLYDKKKAKRFTRMFFVGVDDPDTPFIAETKDGKFAMFLFPESALPMTREEIIAGLKRLQLFNYATVLGVLSYADEAAYWVVINMERLYAATSGEEKHLFLLRHIIGGEERGQ